VAAGVGILGFIASWIKDKRNCDKIMKEGNIVNEEEMPLTREELK